MKKKAMIIGISIILLLATILIAVVIVPSSLSSLLFNGVEVEETNEGLVLRLKVANIEAGKLAVENGVLSTATITK